MANPFRPVQLGASVALSTVLSGGVSTLPPGNFSDVARALVGFCGVALSTKVVCETLVDDANAESTAQESEVQAALTRDLYRANAAYYREYPHHWKASKPVPDGWLELWGQTGGKPYLALHPSSPQAFAPIAPIAPIAQQPQPQTQTVQRHESGVRGGSFDITDGFAPSHPQAPVAQPPTFTAPITATSPKPYTPALFAWESFQQRPDKFPHACVVGATGDGKTATQEWITRSIAGGNHLQVLSTKRKSDQWVGLQVTGLGRSFAPVSEAWHELESELDRRCLDLDHAQTLPQRIIAIDELNDLVANSDLDLANIARAGREPRIRLVVNSHSVGVDGLGLKGKQDLKACFTWIRLGSFALHHAQTLANKGLLDNRDLAWLGAMQWPCMVDDSMAKLPDLSPGWQARLAGSQHHHSEPTPPTPEPPSHQSLHVDFGGVVHGSELSLNHLTPPQIALQPAPEPANDREAELLSQFSEFKDLGMNKAQICFALWGAKKGGTDRYRMASDFYDRLNFIYSRIAGEQAA